MQIPFRNLILFVSILVITTVFLPHSAQAQGDSVWTPARKLDRGISNTATGFLEVPYEVRRTAQRKTLFDAWTSGLARGVGLAFARTGAGIYDAATFFYPAPEEYKPVIRPEFIIAPE